MSIGEYIWANDVKKSPGKILAFFENKLSDLGPIERMHIDIACLEYNRQKEYVIYVRPDRKVKKGDRELMVTGDNMCLKLGNDGASAPALANRIYEFLSKKYPCVGERRHVANATDTRHFNKNSTVTQLTFPIAE